MTEVQIRSMTPADVPATEAITWAAMQWAIPEDFRPDPEVRAARARDRVAHLQQTDPGGAFVACDGDSGELVGTAMAFVREGLWGLSLLMVSPEHQGRRIGGRLLDAALATQTGPGLIVSSTNPAAMRAYARAGFSLRPCLAAAGMLDRGGLPSGLAARPGDPDADAQTLIDAARFVRGAAYGQDVARAVAHQGHELLTITGRGFALHREGSPSLLCAHDEDAAHDLLLSCLAAAAPGATVHVDFIGPGQDWAIAAVLDCGLALSPEGPLCVCDVDAPLAPYLPSGAYL